MNRGVLITGASGLVGTALVALLHQRGYHVFQLSSTVHHPEKKIFKWDYQNNIFPDHIIPHIDYIIHLAGASVADGRWTANRKKEIYNSRIGTANFLFEKFCSNRKKLIGFITSSATGWYGNKSTPCNETLPAANDFLGATCLAWEEAGLQFHKISQFTCCIRTGVVLSSKGGALPVMAAPVKFFLGAPLGSGHQIIPWIDLDDLCNIYLHVIEHQLSGSYNAAAPSITSNALFIKTLSQFFKRPFWNFPVPAFFLRALLGEKSAIVLHGQNIDSSKIINTGYNFKFINLFEALQNSYDGS